MAEDLAREGGSLFEQWDNPRKGRSYATLSSLLAKSRPLVGGGSGFPSCL